VKGGRLLVWRKFWYKVDVEFVTMFLSHAQEFICTALSFPLCLSRKIGDNTKYWPFELRVPIRKF